MATHRPLIIDRALRIVAESKIQAAIDADEFDNLPGFGKPAAICDEQYDPLWWIRRKLQREQLTPVQIEGGILGWKAGCADSR